jgi:TRAP-type C4-dicarboxylate transport system substrate-binding protein
MIGKIIQNAIRTGALVAILAAPAAADGPLLIVASTQAPGSSMRPAFVSFGENIRKTWTGPIEVKLLIDGESGSEETSLAALRRERVHFSSVTIAAAATAVPELAVLMTPYLFDNDVEGDFVLDNFLLAAFRPLFAERNVHLIRWIDSGWANIYAAKPVAGPEDLKGRRMRAASIRSAQTFLTSLKADVVPLTFADTIPALQTGLIDGGATATFMYRSGGLNTYAPYLILTRHAINPGAVVVSKSWFDRQLPANQTAVESSMAGADDMRRAVRIDACNAMSKLAGEGVIVRVPADNERQRWIALTRPSHQAMIDDIGGETAAILDAVARGKVEFQRRKSELPDHVDAPCPIW